MSVRLAAILIFAAVGLSSFPAAAPHELVTRDAYLMGTRVHLATYSSDRTAGLALLASALDILEGADAELSTWRADSAISGLNRQPVGIPWRAGPRLCSMFGDVFDWQARSTGAFDPAIGRLTDAWGIHDNGRIPTDSQIADALSKSGSGLLVFDRPRCTLTRAGDVTIDVGAFGKGEALDRVSHALHHDAWMIDLGGQVSVHGAPPGDTAWAVAIAHPLDRSRPHLSVRIPEGSLSTSAGSERDLQVNGRRVSHHVDPRTGQPVNFRGSVSVWHRSALAADALSTALYVMGPDTGLRWAEERGLSVCFLIPNNDGSVRTATTTAFGRLVG